MSLTTFALGLVLSCLFTGCISRTQQWDPKEYFDDSDVVAVCRAIQRDNLAEVTKLLDSVDVNIKGRDNMTLLAWAMHHERLEIFELLLKKKADPNVRFLSNFSHPFEKGGTVVHVAARAPYQYFELVMDHGGDSNLAGMKYEESPLLTVIKHGGKRKLKKVTLLLDKGADIEYSGTLGDTPLQQAISWGGQYDIALKLLERGADPLKYRSDGYQNAAHIALRENRRSATWSNAQTADYQSLLLALEKNGCRMDEARADILRWESWGPMPPSEVKRRREQEIQLARDRQAERSD